MRIGLFVPCYIDAFFPEVGIATLELLERLGHEVVYPRGQTCCGQPMANSGFNAECAATEALFVRLDDMLIEGAALGADADALSNPTDKAGCSAEQAYAWSGGKALFAAGVQFPDVTLNGQTFHPGQANNFYIFPAVGLATYVARPRRLTDECFIVAAQASADQVGADLRAKGMLFPSQTDILETEVMTAARVAEFMFDRDLVERPRDIRAWIEGQLYKPQY